MIEGFDLMKVLKFTVSEDRDGDNQGLISSAQLVSHVPLVCYLSKRQVK